MNYIYILNYNNYFNSNSLIAMVDDAHCSRHLENDVQVVHGDVLSNITLTAKYF